jgi:glycosyltransferase involved in cell wall biosynthesis
MKILYVVPSWFTLHYQLAGQLEFLTCEGMEIHIVSSPDPRAKEVADRIGVTFHPLDLAWSGAPWRSVQALAGLMRIIRIVKPDVVQSCTKKGGLISGFAGLLTKTPVVYVVFGLIAENASAWKERLFRPVERLICTLAKYVVVISRSNMQSFRDRNLCSPSKLVLFGRGSAAGVDTHRFKRTPSAEAEGRALRSSLEIPNDAQVLGFVGRIVVEKGIRELITAWETLRDRFPNTHLLLASPPELDPRLVEAVGALQQDDPRVHFIGFLPDPRPAYAAMNCLVLPSYSEGFGNVILEGGAMGVPAIATRAQGCVDAVLHRQTGLLIEPRDSSALAEAVASILLHPDEAEMWGRRARERCIRDFKPEVIWQGYADLYNSLDSSCDVQPQDLSKGCIDSHTSGVA